MSPPKVRPSLTAERLKQLLRYDPDTGVFTWIAQVSTRKPKGSEAGYVSPDGYRHIYVDKVKYPAHWLAWLYVTNSLPKELLDHANGVRGDNRIANLREATHRENQQNKVRRINKHGVPGVYETGGRFLSRIITAQGRVYLGSFGTKEEASAAYLSAKQKYHPFAPDLRERTEQLERYA